jgi:hypothetical protein
VTRRLGLGWRNAACFAITGKDSDVSHG